MKRSLKRSLGHVERLAFQLFDRRANRDPLLEPYRGYATPDRLVLRGRVLTALRRSEPHPDQSRLTNVLQMAALFLTDEVIDVPVRVTTPGGTVVTATSDQEGYLVIDVPRDGTEPGWTTLPVEIDRPGGDSAAFPVLVPGPSADFGVISDIDDTMIHTGAYSLARNLWNTFTGSAITREVFPDAVALMRRLSGDGRNPVYFVSSSPWNLHDFLNELFDRAGLVPGPLFLRDFGLTGSEIGGGSHTSHKANAIDRIMAANPALSFVLIGDTGQRDAAVYLDAIARHPGRVRAVVLREPGPGPDRDDRRIMRRIRATGTTLVSGRDFDEVADVLQLAPDPRR